MSRWLQVIWGSGRQRPVKGQPAVHLAGLLLALSLTACGGGSPEPPPPAVLVASVGSLQGQLLAIGDVARLSGSRSLVAAQASPGVAAGRCLGTTLVSTRDGMQWQPITLTHTSLPQPCVNQMQDAGDFLVIKTLDLLSPTGQSCDLAVIRKQDGRATCVVIPVPDRARSGPPILGLGIEPGLANRSARLSANRRYVVIPFSTDLNPLAAHAGFVRIDLASASPSADIAYLESGELSSLDGSINGHHLTWGPFQVLDSGDLIFTEFTPSSPEHTPGVVRQFYAVNTPGVRDPSAIEKHLINISDALYQVDMLNSPLGRWFKSQHPEVLTLQADARGWSEAHTAGQSTLYGVVAGEGLAADACGASPRRLVRVYRDRASQGLTFSGLGSTHIGDSLDGRPDMRHVLMSSDGTSLYRLRWDLATGTGKADIRLSRRSLGLGPCDQAQITVLSLAVDASVQAQGTSLDAWLNETQGSVFLRTFSAVNGDERTDHSCIARRSCAIDQSSLVLAYDKLRGTVSNIPLGELAASGRYYLEAVQAAAHRDELYLSLVSADGDQRAVAVLNPKGLRSFIELPRDAQLGSIVLSGD